jgi:hypothetical protein
MRRLVMPMALVCGAALSACDDMDSGLERAVIGAAIGCAAGEVLVNGRCVEGAIVGAGVAVVTD